MALDCRQRTFNYIHPATNQPEALRRDNELAGVEDGRKRRCSPTSTHVLQVAEGEGEGEWTLLRTYVYDTDQLSGTGPHCVAGWLTSIQDASSAGGS